MAIRAIQSKINLLSRRKWKVFPYFFFNPLGIAA